MTSTGELLAFHGGLLVGLDPATSRIRRLDVGLVEGHGMTIADSSEFGESLWIADPGLAFRATDDPAHQDGIETTEGVPRVVRISLTGEWLQELPMPDIGQDPYRPTSVVVMEEGAGGDGSIWVADGYGSSLVHRFDHAGRHISTLSGEEGAGRFATPHALMVDPRRGDPELLIADRGNRRVHVYDQGGTFIRMIEDPLMTSPTDLTLWQGGYLVVADLRAQLVVLDEDFHVVEVLGSNPAVLEADGWPNRLDGGRKVRTDALRDRAFNSPHAIATRGDDLIVSEWLIGGRYTALTP